VRPFPIAGYTYARTRALSHSRSLAQMHFMVMKIKNGVPQHVSVRMGRHFFTSFVLE
jgi:hypothetical protein